MYNEDGKLMIIHEYQGEDLQPFLNPICKSTYEALPKIYGNNRKKRYVTQMEGVNYSILHHKMARNCCSIQFEDHQRGATDVKQLRKSKIDSFLVDTKGKGKSTSRKCDHLHKSLEQLQIKKSLSKLRKKVMLPNLKDFQFQELLQGESKHKVYRPQQNTNLTETVRHSQENIKNSVINDIRKPIKTDVSSASEYVQTDKEEQEMKTHKKVKNHMKSLTEMELTDKKYFEHLENERKIMQQNAKGDIRNTSNSQDQTFSISSSAIQKGNMLSTIFHKYKRKQSSNNDNMPDKKRSRVYSVLSNGLFKIPEEQEFEDYLLNYKPMNKEFDVKQLVKEPNFHIVPADGKVFFGQIIDKKKHGKGISVSEKEVFEGRYNQNMKVEGSEKNRDGIYTGEFMNGKRHGKGKFTWYNGQIFDGQWRDGKKNGFGVWKSPKGDSYQGQWKDNRQTGSGIYIHFGGSKYHGQFKDFLKHGKGKEEFPNADRYDGEYFQGKPHGKGKYIWANGDSYEGRFQQGSRSGYGILSRKSGETYEGHFKNDLKHGLGKQHYKSGEQFQGEFKEGERFRGRLKTKAGVAIQITQ